MRVSPRLSGRAGAWRGGLERRARQGAGWPGPFAAERLEARTLLSAAGQGAELGEVLRPPTTLVPLRRRDSVTSGAPGYQIEVSFVGPVTPSQQAAFTTAANRWQQIITGDIPDANTDVGTVDDIRIDASAPFIDGPGGILGQAGPTDLRNGSFLPARGVMEFDSADLATLEAQGQLVPVILHEMGHVLGLGTIWSFKGLITGAGGSDPRFVGQNATAEFNSIFSMEAASVPVENTGGGGTRDSHWRESVFDNELMTGFFNGGRPNPLSRVTAAQFIDLGYPGVVVSAADAYTSPNAAPLAGSLSDTPDPVNQGGSITLTATGFSDPGGSIAGISFFRESNGIAGLQATGGSRDTLLSTDTTSGDGFRATPSTAGLTPGPYTYYARATDGGGALSAAASTTNLVQAPPTSATPGVPDLLPGFDTGLASEDNLTRLDNSAAGAVLQFSVPNTAPGAVVTLLADGIPIGSATAAGATTVVATNGASDLADGVRSITARQTEPGKDPSADSPALAITVDTVAPQVNSFAFLFQSSPNRLTYTFSESVQASLAAADLTVSNLMGGNAPGFTGPAYDPGSNVATFSFGGVLPNAHYSANIAKAGVTDSAGNTLPVDHFFKFFSLTGDINRDRSVNGSDFAILAGNFGKSGQTYDAGDLNGDGLVNGTDFALLASNFGQSLPAIPALVDASVPPPTQVLQSTLVARSATTPADTAPAARRPPPVRAASARRELGKLSRSSGPRLRRLRAAFAAR